MASLTDILFGSPSSSNTEKYTTLSPEQEYLMREIILPYLITDPMVTPYTGQLSAPLSGLEQTALNLIGDAASSPTFGTATKQGQRTVTQAARGNFQTPSGPEMTQQYIDLLGTPSENLPPPDSLVNFLEQGLNPSPTDFTDYYNNAVVAPAMQTFNEQTMPALHSSYAPSGFYSEARLDQENKAAEQLNADILAQSSELAFNAYESAQDRAVKSADIYASLYGQQLSADTDFTKSALFAGTNEAASQRGSTLDAARLAPTLDQGEIDLYKSVLSAGSVPRTVQQQSLDRNYNEFTRQISEESKRLSDYLNFLKIPQIENVTTVKGGTKGLFDYVLAGVGYAGGKKLGGKLF